MRVLTGSGYPYPFNVWHQQSDVEYGVRNTLFSRAVRHVLPGVFPGLSRGFDLVHAFNNIPLDTSVPFGVTFESYLPRVLPIGSNAALERHLWRQLRSDRCKFINAISHYAVRQFVAQNRDREGFDEVHEKIRVVYPCFARDDALSEREEGPLRLLFIGRDFLRKGGGIVARAHQKLAEGGTQVETTIVSTLDWKENDYVAPSDAAFVESETARLRWPGIRHIRSVEPSEVVDLMRRSDLFLSPTLHDTFGYAQCEALARGTPVVTTRTCAQPEIVGGESDCLLDLPVDALGKWSGLEHRHERGYTERFEAISERLSEQLADHVLAIASTPEEIQSKSQDALDRARAVFDRDLHRATLHRQYSVTLSQSKSG